MVQSHRREELEPIEQKAAPIAHGTAGAEQGLRSDQVAVEPTGEGVDIQLRCPTELPPSRGIEAEVFIFAANKNVEASVFWAEIAAVIVAGAKSEVPQTAAARP